MGIFATLAHIVHKFGASDARKLKTLECENARLKKLLADAMLDDTVLKDLLGKSSRHPLSAQRTKGFGRKEHAHWPRYENR